MGIERYEFSNCDSGILSSGRFVLSKTFDHSWSALSPSVLTDVRIFSTAIFGVIPAINASRLRPVDALRHRK